MTDIQVNMDEFTKWTQATTIVRVSKSNKINLSEQEYDMDPEVLSEAKDFVAGWIDKAGAEGTGVNYEVSV